MSEEKYRINGFEDLYDTKYNEKFLKEEDFNILGIKA